MSLLSIYLRVSIYSATALAAVLAFAATLALTVLGVFLISSFVQRTGSSGPGARVLVVCSVPNIAIPSFVGIFTFLVNSHHPTTWRTPTTRFLLGGVITWLWVPFSVEFSPVLLGTEAAAWVVSCLMIRRKGEPRPLHAL
jgi:hypothetical protein